MGPCPYTANMATNSKPTAINNKVGGQKYPSTKIIGFSFFFHNLHA
jgi:hypothetical protein